MRLGRLLFRETIIHRQNIQVDSANEISYLVPNIKENIGFDLFINGSYEPNTTEFIKRCVNKGGTLLDIGANIGAICIPLKKLVPSLTIHAIEASERVYSYLANNVLRNKTEIQTWNIAITENSIDKVKLYSPEDLFGKGSQSPVYTSEAEIVQGITMDDFVANHVQDKVDFIKIDVEGYEYYAFKGGETLLRAADAPDVIFEFNFSSEDHAQGVVPGDAQRLLKEYGYNIYKIGKDLQTSEQYEIITSGSYNLFATKKLLN